MVEGYNESDKQRIREKLLSGLAPNRTHESSWLKALFCSLGLHHLYYPNFAELGLPNQRIGFCHWCDHVKFPPQ